MKTFTATHNGQTLTRKSVKTYTHASLVRWSNGETQIVSFHTSEIAALKGILTGQQKKAGAAVVGTVTVTQV